MHASNDCIIYSDFALAVGPISSLPSQPRTGVVRPSARKLQFPKTHGSGTEIEPLVVR